MAHDNADELPEIEILLERDVAATWSIGPRREGGIATADGAAPTGHVVGHDLLADVITAFGATLEAIRTSQGIDPPRHHMPSGSSSGSGKRIAQVVQATPVRADRVIAIMRDQSVGVPGLDLDVDAPGAGVNDVVFEGRLRMPGSTRRRVELRIYPTTSGNLTVLELLPHRVWMPQTSRYLRAGVPAITALTDRLEDLAEDSDLAHPRV